jgi:hypothetical protein
MIPEHGSKASQVIGVFADRRPPTVDRLVLDLMVVVIFGPVVPDGVPQLLRVRRTSTRATPAIS